MTDNIFTRRHRSSSLISRATEPAFLDILHRLGQDNITLTGTARVVSQAYFMRTVCPRYFRLKSEEMKKGAEIQLEFGEHFFGKSAFQKGRVASTSKRD